MDAFQDAAAPPGPAAAIILCRNVPFGRMEHENAAGKDQRHALRAHCAIKETCCVDCAGTGSAASRGPDHARSGLQGPVCTRLLGLRDTLSESDLESALLREIERFLLELGSGFAFLERQKRIVIGGEDFYLDLLFFHRRLRRLVLVELKLGSFQAADYGQVQLYLRWLDKHEQQPREESPIGLILCAGKSEEKIELLELEQTGVRVAQYLTELPPREILRERLQQAIAAAKARITKTGGSRNTD